jgi:predicted metal-binding protein
MEMNKQTAKNYTERAVKLGAIDAKVISPKSIVTASWVRMKCQYGCGGYGQRLTCPPHSPTPAQTAELLRSYQTAILVHGDDHTDVSDIVAALEREIFLDGRYKAFAMGSGPCRHCRACNLDARECRHPEKARPAMEACGIDVYQTARNNGFPIEVVRDETGDQNYYGVVLIE